MIRTSLHLVVLLTCVDGLSGQVAQEGEGDATEVAALARVDSLYSALDASASLVAAETLATADPDGPAAWRAARAAVSLGMLADGDEAQNEWYRRGEAHAARAVAADSASLDALFWLTAAKGRLALQAGSGDAARLGNEVWRHTHRMLAMDPDHAGAHNVLGKLQYEVMTLSRVERFLAKMILGDNEALDGSTWEGAETHLRRALALDPEAVLYHYDLARMLIRHGREDEGIMELRTVLELPVRYPSDAGIKDDARRRLERLGVRP